MGRVLLYNKSISNKELEYMNEKELEFAGGNGLELNEYIASEEFKK